MSAQPRRGRLVVVEGLDRSGKSSQCQLLVDGLNKAGTTARYVKFPDRTTPTGQMINSYLTGNAQQDDHSIHLLFSANRWEAIGGILDRIDRGETIVIDRYSFSGAVYSAAKDNDNLSLQWAWACEAGLPKPDLVLFLELSSAQAAERGGYGEERYETQKMQTRVRTLFDELFVRLPTVNVRRIDAGQDIDTVAADIMKVVNEAGASDLLKPLEKFEFLAN